MVRIQASTARIRREHKRMENRRRRQNKPPPLDIPSIKQPKQITTTIKISKSGQNLLKARMAKQRKKFVHKAGGAKRTKVAQQLKKRGITADIGIKGLTVTKERTLPIGVEIRRGIGQPTKLTRRDKLGRFQKTHKTIEVISRRTDPAFRIDVKLPKLDRSVPSSGNVASSWIAYLEWNPYAETVTMGLLDGRNYVYKMTFEEYTGWYYAKSKGTYWWEKLRSKYNNKYINKYKL